MIKIFQKILRDLSQVNLNLLCGNNKCNGQVSLSGPEEAF